MPEEERTVEVNRLISLGKEKGFLTYRDLNNGLPAEMATTERLNSLMTMFGEMDIEVIDAPEGERYSPPFLRKRMYSASFLMIAPG